MCVCVCVCVITLLMHFQMEFKKLSIKNVIKKASDDHVTTNYAGLSK